MKLYNLKDIEGILGNYKICGDRQKMSFSNIKPISEADENTLAFISSDKKNVLELFLNTKAKIIICSNSVKIPSQLLSEKHIIMVENPKLTIINILQKLFFKKVEFNIHESAIIHNEAVIHPKVHIGPHTYIGKCKIGENAIIYGNVYIYDNVVIGKNVKIDAGSIIGADGFGYIKKENGESINFPHIGGVVIEDNVEIGANTCIDRGALGNTFIGKGVKISNLVHVSHNVNIGENSYIIANSMIGGSTKIGKNNWIASAACLRDVIVTGNNVIVGMGAIVTKNIPNNETWVGIPAKSFEEFIELQRRLKSLKNVKTED